MDGDIDKIVSHIREKAFVRKELLGSCKEHGTLVFLDKFGIPLPVFLKDGEQANFTWGWTNNSLGYTGKEEPAPKPAPAPAPKPAVAKMGSFADLKRAAANDSKPTSVPATSTAVKPTGEKVMMVRITFPPRASRNDRIAIVRACFNGNLDKVPNYKNVNAFYIDMERAKALQTLGTLEGLDAKEVEIEREPQILPSLKPDVPAEPVKAGPPPAPPKPETTDMMPMLIEGKSAYQFSQLMKDPTVKKEIDSSGNLIMNPSQMKEATGKFAPFFAKAGLKHINQTVAFSPATLQAMLKTDPIGLIVHTINLAQIYVDTLAEVRRLEELITAPDTKEKGKPKMGSFADLKARAM